jgi:hypothetical protein
MPFQNTTDVRDNNTSTNSIGSWFMICTPRQILLASLIRGWLLEGACATLQRGDKCIQIAVKKSEGKKLETPWPKCRQYCSWPYN